MLKFRDRPCLAFSLVLLCLLQGCKSMQTIEGADNPDNILEQVKVGSTVNITTKKGEKLKTKVTSITKEKITGKNVEIAMDHISQIEVRKTDTQKVVGLSVGSAIGGVIIVVVVLGLVFGI